MEKQRVLQGNCFEVLKTLPDNSVDAIISDPPYGLGTIKSTKRLLKSWMRGEDGSDAVGKSGFMGESWDACVPPPRLWKEVLRVLKPGGFLFIFCGTRTQDLMGMSLRLAGAQPRNACAWVYGSGFPKSVDLSREADKTLGAKREKIKVTNVRNPKSIRGGKDIKGGDRPWLKKAREVGYHEADSKEAVTEEAKRLQGWGSDLKPAYESIEIFQKAHSLADFHATVNQWDARLWLLLNASTAKDRSKLKTEEKTRLDIAQWSVEEFINIRDALNAVTGTSQLKSEMTTNWNTVSLWKSILDAVLKLPKTSTIKTELETTTDWKILNSCLLEIMRPYIIKESKKKNGHAVSADNATKFLNATLAKWQITLELFAAENAILRDAGTYREGDANQESILMFRKKLSEKTLIANVLKWGTGGLNIDACRVGDDTLCARPSGQARIGTFKRVNFMVTPERVGRFPTNLILDESMAEVMDAQTQDLHKPGNKTTRTEHKDSQSKFGMGGGAPTTLYDDEDFGATRFFYVAKASQAERELGLDKISEHPTMKPIELMRYLVRMATPKGGVVLDPFNGSGTTGCACAIEGFQYIGIELSKDYVAESKKRIAYFREHRHEFKKKKRIVDAANDVKSTPKFARALFRRDDA